MRAEDARRWVAGRQAAETRERQEARQGGPSPGSAMALALGLIALAGRLHGWPLPEDEDARREAVEFARQNQVLLLRHDPSGTPMEVSLAWLPFEREALARAKSEDLGGVELPVAGPEDLVVYKAVAWRDRDRADIERLLLLHGHRMNLDRVRTLVREFAELLGVPGRAREFDAIVSRAVPGADPPPPA